ncbi:MAG TPA: response regulator transcription factor [Deltaproteobacteria bacterium]|nr:response regulator transcription factor [Deltaproteobacteria bacterium]
MKIRVLIALSNMLFSRGIAGLLAADDGIEVVGIHKTGSRASEAVTAAADIVLVDLMTLYNDMKDGGGGKGKTGRRPRYLLLDTQCGEENIVSALITKKVSGVLRADATEALLKKAVRAVHGGEVWIDKATVKNLLYGLDALKQHKAATLTRRELEIVSLISEGCRNKEIAAKLKISEPTVKAHLNRIFGKLDIHNRAQLVTYAVRNEQLKGLLPSVDVSGNE